MILTSDVRPDDTLYCIGGWAIEAISSLAGSGSRTGVQPELVYSEMKKKHPVSAASFQLAMDWLYLLGALEVDGTGGVILCSSSD